MAALGQHLVLVVRTGTDVNSESKVFSSSELTAGEYNHTLTVSEMPSHRHNLYKGSGGGSTDPISNHSGVAGMNDKGSLFNDTGSDIMDNTGGGNSHNNIQPYITVYMWKRTALAS